MSFRRGADRIPVMVRNDQVKSPNRTRRPKRTVRQRIFRAGVLVFAVLAVVYATLPWWAPKRYLADRLARNLADELSLPVSIGSLEMSWAEGITVSDVHIGNSAGFGEGDMVVVDTLRCDLSPLQMLWTDRLNWMEITGARLDVIFDGDGHANVAALQPLMEMPTPDWMAFRRATATVQFPGHDRRLRLDVADLQYRVGRLENVGRITMSAVLAQNGRGAAVTLAASAARLSSPKSGETYEGAPEAEGSFRFAGVDISQLNLPGLLSLPLKRLSGQASGQIDCRFDRTGRVGQFSLELSIEDLDAQPRRGPALPVIEKADISLTATSDPIYKSIDVRTFGLHLPGIELKGKGRIHADALAGRWEAVRSMEVTGRVNPTTAEALLSGRSPTLPGGMEFDGNVGVDISLRGDKSQMSFSLSLDATASAIRSGRRVVKPAGRKLTAEIHGNIEKHTWRFWTDPARPAELRIGKNRFTGTGAVRNIRRAPDGMDWHGQAEIVELNSIRDLLEGLSAGGSEILRKVRLDGTITGQWYIERDRTGLRNVRLPVGTRLTVGEWFTKPSDRSMEMELSGTVTSDRRGLDDVRFRVGLSRAKSRGSERWDVSVEEGRLTFSSSADGEVESACILGEGRYSVRGIGELFACIPAAQEWKNRLDGSLAGKFNVMLSPSMQRFHLRANATQLKAGIGRDFRKAAGRPAELDVDFQVDKTLPPSLRNRLAVRLELASAVLDGSLTFPSVDAEKPVVRCFGRIRVADAAWLVQSACGAELARTLKPFGIRGSMTASLRAEISDEFVAGELTCNADDLQFRLQSNGLSGRTKPRGGAFRFRLAGKIDEKIAAINILSLDVGKSNLSVTGRIRLSADAKTPPAGKYLPAPFLAGGQLDIRGRLAPCPTTGAILPELAELVERCGLNGAVRFAAKIQADEKRINAAGQFDASEITVSSASVRKARGERAAGRFDLSIPADFSAIKVRDVFIDTDFFQLHADATLPLLGGGGYEAHAALSVPDLSRLGRRFPRIAQYRPSGGVFVEGRLIGRGGANVLEYVTLKADNAAATINKKRCRVDGTVMLEKVTPPDKVYGRVPSLFEWLEGMGIGSVATDSFEFAAGENHGFIVADLRNPTTGPAGRIAVFCTRLDTFDLERWAGGQAVPSDKKPLNTEALVRRADETIARLRRFLSETDLHCRVEVQRMRYFDPKVRAFFEPYGMIADVHVEKGKVRAGYRCGISGGTLEHLYSLDLNEADARVALKVDLKELLVDKNVLAQIAHEFPGNMIYGTFTQAKEVTFSLRDMVMNSLDVRYNPIPVGMGKTVAVEGMVRGKGAPKWMTHIFPGLNLTTYRYRKMTGFAEYLPDGTAENDMIFNGPYDIYMVGNTDVKGIARYTIGVILLSAPQSPEFNHRLRQGRIPILKFQARIKDGRFYDEVVSYPWPTETAYRIFLANNIFYRLWLNAKNKPAAAETSEKPEKN